MLVLQAKVFFGDSEVWRARMFNGFKGLNAGRFKGLEV